MMRNNNVLILVATNFEDVELITTADILSRAAINYQLISVENYWEVKGKYNAIVKTTPLNEIEIEKFNVLFLPGGPGYKLLLENSQTLDIIKQFNQNKQLIAAICAAPEVLIKADVVGKRTITAHPGYGKIKNNSGQEIEVDENLITGRDFEATSKFAHEIVKYLKRHQ